MRISIATKVFVTLLAATSLVVAGMYLFTQRSFNQALVDFVETRHRQDIARFTQRLTQEYQDAGSWGRMRSDSRRWGRMYVMESSGPVQGVIRQGGADGEKIVTTGVYRRTLVRRQAVDPMMERMVLLDTDKSVIVGQPRYSSDLELHPIVIQDRPVGYLGILPGPLEKELAEVRLEEAHTESLAFVAVLMLSLSALFGLPLARTLVRPLCRIADASKQLAQGNYQTRVKVGSTDEIGQLARDMNDLAQALERTEQSRRQMVADISHELRTPLAVLRGELEELQDGIRPVSQEALSSLHGEIMRLNRLVDELYQLSLSDAGALTFHKSTIDVVAVLEEVLASLSYEFDKNGLALALDNRLSEAASVHADPDRLSQLFLNLLTNSLKYTDAGGRLEIDVSREAERLRFDFRDSAPGVPDESLAHLFERFYRVDGSRNRATGGAGLGLAICRNIVEAHQGDIVARHSPLGGLWIRVELPISS